MKHFSPIKLNGSVTLELLLAFGLLTLFVMGVVEYGRLFVMQNMANIAAREAVNVVGRGGTFSQAVDAATNTTSLLDIIGKGQLVYTKLQYSSGSLQVVTQQLEPANQRYLSRLAIRTGTTWNLSAVPPSITSLLQRLPSGHAAFFVEVIAPFSPITPLGVLSGKSELYSVVFFAM